MRKIFRLLVFALPALPTLLQAQETVDTAMMNRIKTEEAQRSQVEIIARNLTDVSGPRLTNSPGYKRAVDYAVQTMKTWGLANAAPEAWGEFGKGWSTEQFSFSMQKPYFEPLIAYPVAWSGSTKGPVSAGLVLLDNWDSATILKKGDSLKGKIVMRRGKSNLRDAFSAYATRLPDTGLNNRPDEYMVDRKMLETYLPFIRADRNKRLLLQKTGALALLTSNSMGRDGTVFVGGTSGYVKNSPEPLPEVAVAPEDYKRLQRLLDDGVPVTLNLNSTNKFYTDDLKGYNVVAEIPGTDPTLKNEVVMLGGHLDSWHSGTGATDNAAGCIAALEAVRLLQTLNVKPLRTIRIALWGGEEQGLFGSFGYAKKHFGDPADMKLKPEQKLVSAYFNLDNGSGKIRGIYAQNNNKVKDIFTAWLKPFADMGATGVTNSNTGSTDHLAFDAVGIPGFQFIQDPLEYETRTHHSNMDVYDHLSIDDLKQASVIMAAFVYNAAMRKQMMPRKPLPKPERFVFDFDEPLD